MRSHQTTMNSRTTVAFIALLSVLAAAGVAEASRGLHLRGRILSEGQPFEGTISYQGGGSDPWLIVEGTYSYKLVFKNDLVQPTEKLKEGARVRVMGKLDGEGGIVVSEPIQVYNAGGSVAEGSGREITTRGLGMSAGGPIVGDFTSIIIPLSLCGSKNNVNRKGLEDMYSGDSPSNGSPTSMKSFLETCSWGKVSFPTNPSKNTIYDGVVSITSDAICSRPQKACDFQAEAAAEAERILAKQGVDIYNYMHRIFLIPTEQPGCELQGVASQGCVGFMGDPPGCRVVVRLEKNGLPALGAVMHEIGHNFNLGHSKKGGDEYGDVSCPMGNFNYGAHCYNPYHTDTLGWTQPAESFTASDLDLGSWVVRTIKPRSTTRNSAIFVDKDATGNRDMYISYLAPVGYDTNMNKIGANRALVYGLYPRDAGASELLTSIGEGQQWATEDNDWPKLFIRLGQDPSNNGALIMLCRANRPGMCSNPPSDVARTGGGPSGNDGEEDFAPPPRRRPPPSPRFRVAPPSPRRP